jgi:hypothetical protein
MQVTDEMARKFAAVYYGSDVPHLVDEIRVAIEAALAAAPAVTVNIKPLEWAVGDWEYTAKTPFGIYRMRENRDQWVMTGLMGGTFNSIDGAQASAQSHYEAAIRSALVPVAAEPVAWVETRDILAFDDGVIEARAQKDDVFNRPLFASPVAQARDGWQNVHRAADALLGTLWQLAFSGKRTHEENWQEMDRRFPQARWLHEALKSVAAAPTPKAEGDGLPPFKPGIHVNELAGIAELLLEDVPTITSHEEMTVRPLLRMSNERDIVGFQWDVPAAKQEGGQ